MAKYLSDILCSAAKQHGQWEIDFRKFNLGCRKIELEYFFKIPKNYYTNSFWRAIVKLHKFLKEKDELPPERFKTGKTPLELRELGQKGEYYYVNQIENLIDVCIVHRKFDFDKYFAAADFDQQKMILNEIHAGMLLLADHFSWDKQPLENAYLKCLEKKLIFQWTAIAKKFSRNKQFSGEIFIDFQRYEIQTFAIIRDKNGNEIQRKIIDTFNGLENINRIFPDDIVKITKGKTKWQNNDFVLFDKNAKEIARVTIL